MIAQIMFFALGFLVATLIALGVLPALNARAKRLAKRRVEALLPMSLDEVRVEHDLIRAESALAQNRKDQVIAKRGEALHQAMLEVAEKTKELEKLQAMVGYFERELSAARARIATLEEKGAGAADSNAVAEENARLSRRIEELADTLMAAQSSGQGDTDRA